LGSHKESHWVIAVGPDAQPLDIRLTVDTSVVKNPEVGVNVDGERVFPDPSTEGNGKGDKVKAKLKQDFVWQKPFRAKITGLNKKNFYEVRPEHLSLENWYPATVVEQREDGLFKANVTIPDGSHGEKTVVYPAVNAEHIRVAEGSRPKLVVPRKTIVLLVPKSDPMHATLAIDGGELMTHFFARPTPAPAPNGGEQLSGRIPRTKVSLQVTKDRKLVTSSVGHDALARFLKGELRAVGQTCEPKKHSWTIEIGPYATHVIDLEKKYKSSKVLTLMVDGTILAEAAAEDLESPEGFWLCSFRLVGETCLEWEVYESDGNGRALDSKGTIEKVSQHQRECKVYLANGDNLTNARLSIDSLDFTSLVPSAPERKEEPLKIQSEALVMTYDLHVPSKCAQSALKKDAAPKPASGGFASFLYACCGSTTVDTNNDLVMSG